MANWWRRGESNSRPHKRCRGIYVRIPRLGLAMPSVRGRANGTASILWVLAPVPGCPGRVASLLMTPVSSRRRRRDGRRGTNYAARANSSLAFVFFPGGLTRPTGDLGAQPRLRQARRNRVAPAGRKCTTPPEGCKRFHANNRNRGLHWREKGGTKSQSLLVNIAQLGRALDCGSSGCGFKSRCSPHVSPGFRGFFVGFGFFRFRPFSAP